MFPRIITYTQVCIFMLLLGERQESMAQRYSCLKQSQTSSSIKISSDNNAPGTWKTVLGPMKIVLERLEEAEDSEDILNWEAMISLKTVRCKLLTDNLSPQVGAIILDSDTIYDVPWMTVNETTDEDGKTDKEVIEFVIEEKPLEETEADVDSEENTFVETKEELDPEEKIFQDIETEEDTKENTFEEMMEELNPEEKIFQDIETEEDTKENTFEETNEELDLEEKIFQDIETEEETKENTIEDSEEKASKEIEVDITQRQPVAMGYVTYQGVGTFKLHAESRHWNRAKEVCESEKAHLVVVDTQYKVDVLLDLFSRQPHIPARAILRNQVYVGISDQVLEGVFYTVFGERFQPWDQSIWVPGEPDEQYPGEDCVTFHVSGKIRDVPCYYSLPFVCQLDLWSVRGGPEDTSASSYSNETMRSARRGEMFWIVACEILLRSIGGCSVSNSVPCSYPVHTSSSIRINSGEHGSQVWKGQLGKLKSEGGHLAVVDSRSKVTSLLDLFSRYPHILKSSALTNQVYVGITDLRDEGVFYTSIGFPFDPRQDQAWLPNEPDDASPGEDCVTFHTTGKLRDVPCYFELPYICEKGTAL
uniref:C-type lectin domain-containing protein n=1 Tax=Timema poppense TaxID=170557 RepID=A0A7R9CU11_TIMPO|nr:unnamed protein product [Timema poppensis]